VTNIANNIISEAKAFIAKTLNFDFILFYACQNWIRTVEVANFAADIVVGKIGTATIKLHELEKIVNNLSWLSGQPINIKKIVFVS
jgi:bifunctional ADP-heptose synthase (sugar kinase/adenylyltransferase)